MLKQHYFKFHKQNHLFNNDNIPINENVVIEKQLFTFFSLPTYKRSFSKPKTIKSLKERMRLLLREQQPMTRTLLESQGYTLKETWNGLQIGTGIGDHTQKYLDSNLSVILNSGEAQ